MITERRTKRGVAIVSARPSVKWRYECAGVPNGIYSVQDGNTWPDHRPPVVLDTIGMAVQTLVALLACPPRVAAAHQHVPLLALADPFDWRVLRLLNLCPAVRLVCPDDPTTLQRWLQHLDGIVPARTGAALSGWMLDPAPDLNLDPLLLPALAALPSSPSIRAAAERCAVSESTMARLLRVTKARLGLPPGDVSRFRPDDLAATILDQLGADSPLRERSV